MNSDHLLIRDLFEELDDVERAELDSRLATSPDLRRRRERWRATVASYCAEAGGEPPRVLLLPPETAARDGRAAVTGWNGLRLAAGLLVAVAAFLAGRASVSLVPGPADSLAGRVQELAGETDRLRRQVALLALDQERVAGRIAAVERLAAMAPQDPSLAASLHQALRDDPSANVRLAAIDALFAAPVLAPPSTELASILQRERVAALRLALLDWIAAARPPQWRSMLRSASEKDGSGMVRDRARRLLGGQS